MFIENRMFKTKLSKKSPIIKGIENNNDNISNEENKSMPDYYVYTDGACLNNGRANAMAGYGIYFGENDERNVSKKINGKQTNNVAELTAIIEAYKIIEEDVIDNNKIVGIVSDSVYSLRCVKSYGEKCDKNNWKDDIPNKELVKTAYDIFKTKPTIKFIHILAHTNKQDIHSLGNEKADELANKAVGCSECSYLEKKKIAKIYLNVPYDNKDEAKMLGAKWDVSKKKWYSTLDNNNNKELNELFGNNN